MRSARGVQLPVDRLLAGDRDGLRPSSVRFVSVAGVGFQLAALPVGVERGWITREEGEARARTILRALADNPENRKAGRVLTTTSTGGRPVRSGVGPELVVSTIDSAILLAGVGVAASYFGGEVRATGDRLIDGTDWAFFVSGDDARAHERGFISLGWKPADPAFPVGEGSLLPYYWLDNGDEHRLVVFMANTPSDPARRVPPEMYYRLRRRALGSYGNSGPMVWFPWSGALFTAFFAHCPSLTTRASAWTTPPPSASSDGPASIGGRTVGATCGCTRSRRWKTHWACQPSGRTPGV